MSKRFYVAKNLRADALALIAQCNEIIADYVEQGYRLTLRQLYYQLVTKNAITNEEKSYKRLSSIVTDARMSGRMDWDAIEDRGRQPDVPSEWDSISSLVDSAVHAFRLPRWEGQERYAELWVEKQALAGVLSPLAREFHVTLMVNKGYSSASAMRESARRLLSKVMRLGDECIGATVFYLGDHDPSGEDMVRDIRERLLLFTENEIDLSVQKIALTTGQVRQYQPPPNPAKITDPRASAYISRGTGRFHGRWTHCPRACSARSFEMRSPIS